MSKIEDLEKQITSLEQERDNIISKMTQLTDEDLNNLSEINNTLFKLRDELIYVKTK